MVIDITKLDSYKWLAENKVLKLDNKKSQARRKENKNDNIYILSAEGLDVEFIKDKDSGRWYFGIRIIKDYVDCVYLGYNIMIYLAKLLEEIKNEVWYYSRY